jgi:ABC-type glycerol-3-phosphate transport system substrate-binding protein
MKKSLFSLLALVIVFSMVLGACAAPAPAPEIIREQVVVTQVVKETEIVKEVVTEKEIVQEFVTAPAGDLRIWGFYDLTNKEDSRAVQLNQTIDSFQATTGITVKYEQVAWDQMATKVALGAIAGGDMPDLIMLGYEYSPGLVSAGALMNIYDDIKGSFFYNDLNDFEKNLNEVNGERYGIGTMVSGGNWYYDVATFPNGWPTQADDWLTECQTLSAEGKYVATFYAGRHSAAMQQGLAPLVWSAGGELFDEEGMPIFANEHTVQAIEWWRELLANNCVPEVSFTGDWSGAEAPFVDKTAGGVRGGSWSYIYITGLKDRFEAGEVAIGSPPGMNGNKGYVFMNTELWAVTSGAQNIDNAISFINFFFNPAVLAPWAKSNFGIPATAAALDNPIFDSQFYEDTMNNLTNHGHKSDTSPYFNESMDALAAAVQELMLNPSQDVMSKLQTVQKELIAKYW